MQPKVTEEDQHPQPSPAHMVWKFGTSGRQKAGQPLLQGRTDKLGREDLGVALWGGLFMESQTEGTPVCDGSSIQVLRVCAPVLLSSCREDRGGSVDRTTAETSGPSGGRGTGRGSAARGAVLWRTVD